ncbi:FabD/lysophospholipase-like protein [Diplogelasinospora grovesii]|uniref:Lysophospholipase n=1 Tax=Diplogelasinospora grovesii TaxID=303347 RepID=A0AAN6NDN3_9PEZI|nr:FabD/lysophospholipase-like protein [Diplogelasinospora grovesii]
MIPSTRSLGRLGQLSLALAGKGRPRTAIRGPHYFLANLRQRRHGFFSSQQKAQSKGPALGAPAVIAIGALLIYSLYPADEFQRLAPKENAALRGAQPDSPEEDAVDNEENTLWFKTTGPFEKVPFTSDLEWSKIPDKVVHLILPEWSKSIPAYVRKLQRELNMEPGSLADEIWQEAHDPSVHPEIQYSAKVRISDDLCDEEKTFLSRRRQVVAVALAKYLGIKEEDVHPDDVPTIAICGSGGGLRALVAGAGSLLATAEDGLFDCVTYTSGVSGSCWLQSLYYSSIGQGSTYHLIDHVKARIGVHIAYPPVAFSSMIFAPTNKYLLSGMVEKLKGDPGADFGLVDVYGLLLAARLLVPKGELGINGNDFKLSNQQEYIKYGQNPLPIYTAVRHEIPGEVAEEATQTDPAGTGGTVSEEAKEIAKQQAWFQWFEITPYEFFCEEFTAGIPTWAMGRTFKEGRDVPRECGYHLPELRMPLLMGIFGSAFCATLSHYYREIRPLVTSLSGFQAVDEMISGHNEDLSKVHPINPSMVRNFAYKMQGKLPETVPKSIYDNEYIQLMDAGMSNNLPIYPLLRPGRDVEIVVAFDASADIKTDNWLSEVDGYARQRNIKSWPVGIGWPKADASPAATAKQLDEAQAASGAEAEGKLTEAKVDQAARRIEAGTTTSTSDKGGGEAVDGERKDKYLQGNEEAGELGYCTVWVGTTQERTSKPPPKAIDDTTHWRLTEPDAGIAVVYLPFLTNDKVPGVDPAASEYMSTWNFVYTPEQIDQVVALAKANYGEGKQRIRATVRAVYERKKKRRQEREARMRHDQFRRHVRLGIVDKLGEGDHFS